MTYARVLELFPDNDACLPLGRKILDPQTRANARVEAFLAVPLFKALFEEYKNSQLPPDKGLEKTRWHFD